MINILKIISEARRGRPKKVSPNDAPAPPKKEKPEEGGREHIIIQLRKAENLRGEKHIEFNDDSKHNIPLHHVKKALNMHQDMKPIPKGEFEKRLATSHASFMSAIKGEKAPAPKPKVSLGSMKKEEVEINELTKKVLASYMDKSQKDDKKPRIAGHALAAAKHSPGLSGLILPKDKRLKVPASDAYDVKEAVSDNASPTEPGTGADPITNRSDRGNLKTYVAVGTDGRVKLVKHRDHRKQIKIESVSVNMQQDSLNKLKKEPQASPNDIKTLPPTQGNKPIGGEEQVHTGKFSVAEETILNNLYSNLNEENKVKFDSLYQTEQGIKKLLDFAKQQGLD